VDYGRVVCGQGFPFTQILDAKFQHHPCGTLNLTNDERCGPWAVGYGLYGVRLWTKDEGRKALHDKGGKD
jgi:hypothetical protein